MRHGQSAFNAVFNETRVDPGIPDPGLTELGRGQAAALAAMLARHAVRRLLASPYSRALETAAIIAERLGVPIAVEPLVRERAFFVCDIGTRRSELMRRWPGLDFTALDERWWPVAEETEAELGQRCERFRAAMGALLDWPRVAVVSHWAFIRSLTGRELANGDCIEFDPRELVERATAAVLP